MKWKFTNEQKEMLKDLNQEHILLLNEEKAFELVPYYQIKDLPANISAFYFTRKGENYVVYWHQNGNVALRLPLEPEDYRVLEELYAEPLPVSDEIPIDKRRYVKSKLPLETLIAAFQKAELKEG